MRKAVENAEELVIMEIRKDILKASGYKCQQCGVKKGTICLPNSDTGYTELDEFQQKFYRKQGVKLVKIFLRLFNLTDNRFSTNKNDYAVLCPLHSQVYVKELVRAGRSNKLGKLGAVRISHIKEVQNFVFFETGKHISFKTAMQLYFRMEEVMNK